MTCDLCVPRQKAGDPLPHWDAKDKHRGWHSRRYPTRREQDIARKTYKDTHRKK